MSRKILFVDNHKIVLNMVKQLFSGTGYTVFIAESSEEALSILSNNTVDLIITEMHLPQITGHQLLGKVKALYPNTIRLISSSSPNNGDILQTIIDGSAQMYIMKHWDNQKLLEAVDNLLTVRDYFERKQLLDYINHIDSLPTIASSYAKIMQKIASQADIREIAAVVEEDQSLTARILQLLNSSFYGVKTASVQHAIAYLGLNTLKNVVITTSVFKIIQGHRHYDDLFLHASHTNMLVAKLHEKIFGKRLSAEWATAGLLHDIGKVLMLNIYPDKYPALLTDLSRPLLELEQEQFAVTHQELGAYLLNYWQLPYNIVETALFHHNPSTSPVIHRELVYLVHIADCLSERKLKIPREIDQEVLDVFGLTLEQCEHLAFTARDR